MTRVAPLSAFDVLGVTPVDDFATIRRAWVRLVKANHPDVVGGDLEALTRKLAEINDAYDSLRWHNPEKVRIRAQQADGGDRRDKAERRAPARRPADPAPETGGSEVSMTGLDRRATAARRAGDIPPGRRATREGVRTVPGTIDARALYEAIREICSPAAPQTGAQPCLHL